MKVSPDLYRKAILECHLAKAWEMCEYFQAATWPEFREDIAGMKDNPGLSLYEAMSTYVRSYPNVEIAETLCDLMMATWERNPEALGESNTFELFIKYSHLLGKQLISKLCGPEAKLQPVIASILDKGKFMHPLFKLEDDYKALIFDCMTEAHGLDVNYVCAGGKSLFGSLVTCTFTERAAYHLSKNPKFKIPINEPGGLFRKMFHCTSSYVVGWFALLPEFQQPLLDNNGISFHGMAVNFDCSMVMHADWTAIAQKPDHKLLDLVAINGKGEDVADTILRLNKHGLLLAPRNPHGTHLFPKFLRKKDKFGIWALLHPVSKEYSDAALACFGYKGTFDGAFALAIPLLVADGYYQYSNRLHRMRAIRFFQIMARLPHELRDKLVYKGGHVILNTHIVLAYLHILATQINTN